MVNTRQYIVPDLCPEPLWFAVTLPMADLCLLFPVGVWLFPRPPADQITQRAAPDKRGPSLEDTYDAGRFSGAPSDSRFPMARGNED